MNLKTILEGLAGAVAIAGMVLLSPLLRGWYSRRGATQDEASRPFPGDGLVPRPKSELTLAVDVQALPEQVWPWFVQLGCQRAGWYSYDLLDNGGQPSAERILPEFQSLELGQTVKAVPKGDFGFPVAALEPCQALVLGGTLNIKTGQPAEPGDPSLKAYFSGDQTILLEPAGAGGTRLFFRSRLDWNPSFANTLAFRVFLEPVSFVMARKTLLGVKRRAEVCR